MEANHLASPPRRVMVVEDSTDELALMLRALRRIAPQVQVVEFSVPEAALAHLQEVMADGGRRAERYALLVVDLCLGGISGFEFIRIAKSDPDMRRVPLVVFSSSRTDEDLRTCYGLGANSCVRKPVDYLEFEKTVGDLYHYWLRVSELPPCVGT
jgi:CheY-like chemotaxis protein